MKHICLIYVLLFGIVLTSCSLAKKGDSSENETEPITITVDPTIEKNINCSELFDSITFLPLRKADEGVIGTIDKIEFSDSKLYLLDKKTSTIWIYTDDGKYLNKINKKGRGPGEYTAIMDFNLDRKNRQIIVLDRTSKKLVFYDFNGKFIRENRIDLMANAFAIAGDNSYWFFTKGNDLFTVDGSDSLGYNLFFVKENKIEKKYFPYNENFENLFFNDVFTAGANGEDLIFRYAYHNQIYSLNNDGTLNDVYYIDFEKSNIPFEKYKEKPLEHLPTYAHPGYIAQSKDYLFCNYSHDNKLKYIIYTRENKKVINWRRLENDFNNINIAWKAPVKLIENKFYFIKDAFEIINDIQNSKSKNNIPPELFELNETSNPVIITAYLKSF